MENQITETRGAKPKYDFNIKIGEIKQFTGTYSATIINCSKSYCAQRGLDWSFKTWTIDGVVFIVRVK